MKRYELSVQKPIFLPFGACAPLTARDAQRAMKPIGQYAAEQSFAAPPCNGRRQPGGQRTAILSSVADRRSAGRLAYTKPQVSANAVGLVGRTGETANALSASRLTPDAVRGTLGKLLQGQSVMLATNEIMAVVGLAFVVSAFVIWLAPKSTRKVDMAQAVH